MIYVEEYKRLIDITASEAEKCGVSTKDVMGKSKLKGVVIARHNAMARMRNELPLSYAEIGYFFRRDHSTVMYGVKNH